MGRGHIEETRRLATGGPYRHTRNPLYLGSVMICSGIALAAAHPVALAVTAAYLLAFFPYTIRSERQFLHQRFGREYAGVGIARARIRSATDTRGTSGKRFAWRLAMSNHEWKALLGPPVALALLYSRSLLLP